MFVHSVLDQTIVVIDIFSDYCWLKKKIELGIRVNLKVVKILFFLMS